MNILKYQPFCVFFSIRIYLFSYVCINLVGVWIKRNVFEHIDTPFLNKSYKIWVLNRYFHSKMVEDCNRSKKGFISIKILDLKNRPFSTSIIYIFMKYCFISCKIKNKRLVTWNKTWRDDHSNNHLENMFFFV